MEEKKCYLPVEKVDYLKAHIATLKEQNRSDHESNEFDSYNWRNEGRYKAYEEVLQWVNEGSPNPGLPLPEPILTDKDVRDWEGEKGQTWAGWVKASIPNIKDGEYISKYRKSPNDAWHIGVSVVDATHIHFIEKVSYNIKWQKGHEELHNLFILDESGTAAPNWTPADTKPEHNVGVLVFIPGEDNHITSGMWDISNEWVLLDEYRTPDEEVTHWMPLPAFPEGYPRNELPDEVTAMIKETARDELGKKEQPAAGREEDAVEFAEWLDITRNSNNEIWKDMRIWGKEDAFKLVYELFKQQKEK